MSSIELRGLGKSFGPVEVLRDIDLVIGDGEFVTFVGPSGCGKSTLLRLIAGLEEVTRGEIVIDGRDVTRAEPFDRGLAMVFQSYALYPHMNVRKNIEFALRTARLPEAEIKARVAKAAQMLQLEDYLDRRPRELSGGQRQRVAIGRAIVREPTAFLFDEPLSNLDAALRSDTRLEIARLHQDLATTMIYVTHDQVEAMTLADRIVVLAEGTIQQVDSPENLYERPANRFVAEFIGSPRMNILPAARAGAEEISIAGSGPIAVGPLPDGEIAEVGLRPEHLAACPPGQARLGGQLSHLEYLGADASLFVRLGAGEDFTVIRTNGRTKFRPGDTVGLDFRPEDMHLFDSAGHALRA
ncbi:MAG: ABC transporter ATP-binding protein [Rhodobacterales bacterium]|nr:MAG: ABC transporter ATP-binding protein [Rhodobacterales bacterium]